ncbi:MAG TPA: hypothetical protein VG734_03465 [Lacunisphaera sp.]|nr:hypothetical protein [Lacunisphaera sp.]
MRIGIVPAFLLCILLTGCESVSGSFSEAVPPQVQLVEGSREEVYFAAQQAFKRLDFVLTRSVMGQVEAASAIHTSEAFGNSRQQIARVVIREAEAGKSEVQLWVTEETASQSMGGTRRQPLRENGLFQLYFAMLQQVLHERSDGGPSGKS